MKPILPALLATACLLASCQDRVSEPSPSSESASKNVDAVSFRLAPSSVGQVVSGCDSVLVTAIYADGSSRIARMALADVLDVATGVVAVPDLPLRDCVLDIAFPSRDGKTRLHMRVSFELEQLIDTLVVAPIDTVRVDTTRIDTVIMVPIDTTPVHARDSALLMPTKDAWIGPENYNAGLAAELRLWEGGSIGLVDFGNLSVSLGGRTIASATLVLHGWKGRVSIGTGNTDLRIDVGSAPGGWTEGTGHWYWFDGAGQNGYEEAFTLWPGYVPPAGTSNPAARDGITWGSGIAQREGFRADTTFAPSLVDGPDRRFPTEAGCSTISIDVTATIRRIAASADGASVAIRRSTSSASPEESIGFYTKDMDPSVAPRLLVRFAD